MKDFVLVLGGGAAKGYAHIGILKVLEEENLIPSLIVGTSMGAIIGGIYACGINSKELTDFAEKMNKRALFDFSMGSALFKDSILSGKKIQRVMYNILKDKTHRQLKIKFACVASEITTGKQHVLKTGEVWRNVLASSAIPGVFPSINIKGKVLCDGGLVNNVPDSVARKMKPDAVILSVDVIGDYSKQVEDGGFKIMTHIINLTTLFQSQLVSLRPVESDIRLTLSQPEIKQMEFTKENLHKAIENGEKAMRGKINELKSLLNA